MTKIALKLQKNVQIIKRKVTVNVNNNSIQTIIEEIICVHNVTVLSLSVLIKSVKTNILIELRIHIAYFVFVDI